VIEAKRAGISHRNGVGQAKDYAARLGSRFAYASNGLNWYQVDMTTGTEGDLALPFPSPDALWERTFADHNLWRERFGEVPFETDGGKWELRYYQHNAIIAALEALAKGDRRILLTLATGTGKTSIAFQIAWKLFQAKWNLSGEPVRRPRILFLADRNILADQAYNAFSAFPNDAITRIDPDTLRKNRGAPPRNASLFFTIFQTFMTGEPGPVYKQYAPDFFDFIAIDECHRGGAKDESEWRGLLEYFEPAAQLGLTATPKRKHNADTYAYFGEPVYTYALRDGIEDGFLTPFKVRQMASTIDDYVYDSTDDVIAGEVEDGDAFTEGDFNTRIIIRDRELSRVKEFMRQMDQRQKTLVFCATQDHAALTALAMHQNIEPRTQLASQAFPDCCPPGFKLWAGGRDIRDRKVMPAHVACHHFLSERCHSKCLHLVGLDQGHDRRGIPRCNRIQVEPQIPLPAARHGAGLYLAGTERDANAARSGKGQNFGDLKGVADTCTHTDWISKRSLDREDGHGYGWTIGIPF